MSIRKPSIAIIYGQTTPMPSASWTRIWSFADEWTRQKHQVCIVGSFSLTTIRKIGYFSRKKTHLLNVIPSINLLHPLFFSLNILFSTIVSFIFLLISRIRMVVVSIPPGYLGIGTIIASSLLKRSCIVDYRDQWEELSLNTRYSAFYTKIMKWTSLLYRKCSMVSTATAKFQSDLAARGVENTVLTPNGADTRTFTPLKKQRTNEIRICYMGGVGGYYRLDIVTKALELSKNPCVKLIIIGNGKIDEVIDLARDLGVLDRIEYHGVIHDRKELADTVSNCHVGIVPYDDNPLWENTMPTKFYEYCACGLAIIAMTRNGSLLAEIVKKRKIGFLTTPLDADELAQVFSRLPQQHEFIDQAGRNSRSFVELKFNRQNIARQLLLEIQNTSK